MRPGFLRYLRVEILVAVVIAAVCVGLILAGDHSPQVVGVAVLAVIIAAGDHFVTRGRR